jgi:hypothetical protein
MRLAAQLGLAFASAALLAKINLATYADSRTHYAKGMPPSRTQIIQNYPVFARTENAGCGHPV